MLENEIDEDVDDGMTMTRVDELWREIVTQSTGPGSSVALMTLTRSTCTPGSIIMGSGLC